MSNPAERTEAALRSRGFVSPRELLSVDREHGDLRDGDTWGRWTWDASRRVLSIDAFGPGNTYEVDIDRAQTPAAVHDWIAHVSDKPWASDADLGALVRALRAVLDRSEDR